MVFNFAQKRKSKKSRGKVPDAAGAPVAFGPVYAALSDMEVGGRGILGEFDMPEHVAEQLMNLGLVPGLEVTVAQSGPGGDPRVYRVDGVEVALRGELAKLIAVTPAAQPATEHTVSPREKSAALAGVQGNQKRPSLRCAKDGAPLDVGLSTQEASAD